MGLFSGSASSMYQREVVEAHDAHWLICLVLDQTTVEHSEPTRLALAIRCNPDGSVHLPSAGAQLICFVPMETAARIARIAVCEARGHVIRDKERMWGGKMMRSCECMKNESSREPTADERR